MINWRAVGVIGLAAAVIGYRFRDRRRLEEALREVAELRKEASMESKSATKGVSSLQSGRTVEPAATPREDEPRVLRVVQGYAGDALIIEDHCYRRGEVTPYGVLALVRDMCGVSVGFDRRIAFLFPVVGGARSSASAGDSGLPEYAHGGREGSLPPLE